MRRVTGSTWDEEKDPNPEEEEEACEEKESKNDNVTPSQDTNMTRGTMLPYTSAWRILAASPPNTSR